MPVDPPYEIIADGLKAGEVVPFFGAAASAVYNRPPHPAMPFGTELAATLARAASYPAVDEPHDLALVASWFEHVQGNRRRLNGKLHEAFAVPGTPGLLHEKLAAIAATRLYVTTNYDDLPEQALAPRTPHLIIDRGDKGLRVVVQGKTSPPGSAPVGAGTSPLSAASTGDDLYGLLNDPQTNEPSHPVLFKMHGSVDHADPRNDCYLITEEDYVDFLGRAGGKYIPPYISALMDGKDFLFLGYSLEDWNVRVILRKLLTRPVSGGVKFWAVVDGPNEIQQQVWQAQNLNIYPMDLLVFADKLAQYL
jgi:hypothetical protein